MSAEKTRTRSPATTLREETADDHRVAERSPFQRALVSGRAPLSGYLAWLGQMHLVYQALERIRLPDLAPGPITERQWARTGFLLEDFRFFDIDPAGLVPSDITRTFTTAVDRWATTDPIALLGPLYVLEGSTNGGRFIARSVVRAYRLPEGRGTRFLDPYGDHQQEKWHAFKSDLDRAIRSDQLESVVNSAKATFAMAGAIGGPGSPEIDGSENP